MIKKNEIVNNLLIEDYAFNAGGIAKPVFEGEERGFVIFIAGAVPGDIVNARITKKKKNYAEAVAVEIVKASADRINPRCTYFGFCGGCKQQYLSYERQIEYKQKHVADALEKIGGLSGYELLPIIPSENLFFYRNKMEFSFTRKRWLMPGEKEADENLSNIFGLGLHVPRFFDKVIDIEECFLQSEISNRILNFSRDYFKKHNVSIYSNKDEEGLLRNLVIRQAYNTNGLMVNLVTSREDEVVNQYAADLLKAFPEITTILNNVNSRRAMVAQGEYEKVLYGEGVIYDTIGGLKFRISANSFFQTNTLQAENLYKTALEFAAFKGDEIVYDMYSGAGTIALYVSGHVKKIYGFEAVQPAVADANINKELNGCSHAEFITADLYKSFLPVIEEKQIEKPDVIILDPPRSGLHPVTVSDVLQIKPQKIVYVSCNPATQANDIKQFVGDGYDLIKVRPVDMFPQTYHIENVALLVRAN